MRRILAGFSRHGRANPVAVAALAVILPLLAGCSASPQTYVEKGSVMLERGKYEAARAMFRRALARDPRYGLAYARLGLAEQKLGNHAAAIAAYRRALNELPRDHPAARGARTELALLSLHYQLNSETIGDAARTASDLLHADANSYDGRRIQALVSFKAAQWWRTRDSKAYAAAIQDCLQEYQAANRIKPGEKEVMLALARVYAIDSRFPDSAQVYTAMLSQWPDFAPAYAEAYRLALLQGKSGEAVQVLNAAIRHVANPGWFVRMLAAQAAASGDRRQLDGAVAMLKAQAKGSGTGLLTAGDFYLRIGDLGGAMREYRACEAASRQSKTLCEQRIIDILLHQGRASEAMRLNDAVLKANPRDSSAMARRAAANIDQGNSSQALNDLETAELYDPKNFEVRYQMARAHLRANEIEQARQSALDTIELNGSFLPAWQMLAQIQFRNREYTAAPDTVKQILARSPRDPGGLVMQKFLEIYRQRRQANPSQSGTDDLSLSAASHYLGLGQYAAAEKALVQQASSMPVGEADRSEAAKEPRDIPQNSDQQFGRSLYLRGSACEEALERYRALQSRPEDPFALADPVPGVAYVPSDGM